MADETMRASTRRIYHVFQTRSVHQIPAKSRRFGIRIALGFFLVCAWVFACRSDSNTAPAGGDPKPSFPIPFPRDVKWVAVERGKDFNQLEVLVARGNRWRLEQVPLAKSRILVVVYDGSQLATSYKTRSQNPAVLDFRTHFEKGYKDLASARYVGIESFRSRRCWHFILTEKSPRAKDVEAHLWVDVKTKLPCKTTVRLDNPSFEETYDFEDLPEDLVLPPDLFDVKNLQPRLLPQVKERMPWLTNP